MNNYCLVKHAWIGLLLICFCLGCGTGPNLNAVSGNVTYQGAPLADVILNFIPSDGRPGQAMTDEAGNFSSVVYDEDHNGLLTGNYQVVITWVSSAEPASPADPPPPPPEKLRPILEKYGDFSRPQIDVVIEKGQRTLELKLD